MIKIHQYGLYRSGTCYINWLIKNNFKDVYILPDGKHERPVYKRHFLYIFSFKTPLAWIRSFQLYMKNERRRVIPLQVAIDWYNDINSTYIHFHERNPEQCVLIGYEFLLKDYRAVLRHIEKKFNLVRQENRRPFINAEKKMHRGNNFFPNAPKFNKSFYTEELYLQYFNINQKMLVRDKIRGFIQQKVDKYGRENFK